jgi:isopenicillin N synthase-like dioxygenase
MKTQQNRIISPQQQTVSSASTPPYGKIPRFRRRRTNHASLPIVDIDRLNDRNPSVQRSTAERIGEIAMANGFLYIRNHGVSIDLIDAVYEQSKYFFDKSLATKNRYYIGNSRNHRGYVPTTEKGSYADENGPRRYEAFDLGLDIPYQTKAATGVPLLGPNLWPDQSGFKKTILQYLKEMRRVTLTMCQAFEMVLDLPTGFFRQQMQNPMSQLRLLHYLDNTNLAGGNKGVNMGAHTDYEFFTILHSRSAGLEVYDLNSNWIAAPPVDNTFYFNIGDMLEAWSGGLFVSTPHRVINNEERYSMPYFAATDYGTVVKPVRSKKYRAKQKAYSSVVAGDHLVSQLLRDFPYLRDRHAKGSLTLDNIYQQRNPFENRIYATAS